MKTVNVATNRQGVVGSEPVEAEANHGFAVHRSVEIKGWTITHPASGYAIVQGIRSRELARLYADTFVRALDAVGCKAAFLAATSRNEAMAAVGEHRPAFSTLVRHFVNSFSPEASFVDFCVVAGVDVPSQN